MLKTRAQRRKIDEAEDDANSFSLNRMKQQIESMRVELDNMRNTLHLIVIKLNQRGEWKWKY